MPGIPKRPSRPLSKRISSRTGSNRSPARASITVSKAASECRSEEDVAMSHARHSEAAFETVIEAHLLQNGFQSLTRESFDHGLEGRFGMQIGRRCRNEPCPAFRSGLRDRYRSASPPERVPIAHPRELRSRSRRPLRNADRKKMSQ